MLTADQMCALLADCSGGDLVPRRDTATILLFADTGIRLFDLANLTVDNLDLAGGLLTSSGWEVRLYAKVATSMIVGALAAVGFLRTCRMRAS
jgi:site-specific recombinase XerC